MLVEVLAEGERGGIGSVALDEGGGDDLNLFGGNAEMLEAGGGHGGVGFMEGEVMAGFDGASGTENAVIVSGLVEIDGVLEGAVIEPAFEGHVAVVGGAGEA